MVVGIFKGFICYVSNPLLVYPFSLFYQPKKFKSLGASSPDMLLYVWEVGGSMCPLSALHAFFMIWFDVQGSCGRNWFLHESLGNHCDLYKNWRDKTHTIISKSWELLHTPPTYKGPCVADCSSNIHKTFPESFMALPQLEQYCMAWTWSRWTWVQI